MYLLETATETIAYATYELARAAQLAHPDRLGSSITAA
ncbi:hypothetical protein SEA_PATIO_90 [Gordonia phage Patio]|uniref:Uncharacterized protein n=1 Tax=Gordonia phage Patio TaxID=2041515 RepID=A0A2D2W4R5_9CAUD|nr:hypothetical protein KNT76_gp90 [Gordonia phage Patio]ATS93171.1 hypothetical protein SEA_PATIO_90 [Gordonia phage Patio]